mmetsp:Transcript_3780/g.8222  ORF Transcript_3780/g.8222 Transcript_3780/m.8222 type:complete len:99 (+) Transcript_3780:2470-2766(+)
MSPSPGLMTGSPVAPPGWLAGWLGVELPVRFVRLVMGLTVDSAVLSIECEAVNHVDIVQGAVVVWIRWGANAIAADDDDPIAAAPAASTSSAAAGVAA